MVIVIVVKVMIIIMIIMINSNSNSQKDGRAVETLALRRAQLGAEGLERRRALLCTT